MQVLVKKSGFIYGDLYAEGDKITLKPVTCFSLKDLKGNPRIMSPEDQFSDSWMEKIKAKPGRKPKVEADEPE